MIAEVILIITIIALIVVLLIEAREYRRAAKFSQALETSIIAYNMTFASLVDTIKVIERAYGQSTEGHTVISDQLAILWNIIEVHNRALMLDPSLTKIGKNENKIP